MTGQPIADRVTIGEQEVICGATELDRALAGTFFAPMRAALAYWRERAGPHGVMRRSDLHPEELARLLPNIFLVDRLDGKPFDVAFRLVGTVITQVEGEMTGRRLSDLIPRAKDPVVWDHFARAFAGEACLRRHTLRWQERDHILYHVLMMPMTRGGQEVDALFGMALYRIRKAGSAPPPY